jgi:hypothetical protein
MKKTLLGGFVLLALFSSCTKDDDASTDPSKKRLVKTESQEDPLEYTSFNYNTDKVLTSITDNYLNGNNERVAEISSAGYVNGQLTSVSLGTKVDFSDVLLRYTLDYDSKGRVIRSHDKEATANTPGYDVYDSIAYNAAGYIRFVFRIGRGANGIEFLDDLKALKWDANGNMTEVFTGDAQDSSTIETTYRYRTVYTYDNKYNPFSRIVLPIFWSIIVDDFRNTYMSKNNVTKEVYYGNGFTDYTTYTYTYDADGYPLTSIMKIGPADNPTREAGSIKFTYTTN